MNPELRTPINGNVCSEAIAEIGHLLIPAIVSARFLELLLATSVTS
jgi:hypothetical protein